MAYIKAECEDAWEYPVQCVGIYCTRIQVPCCTCERVLWRLRSRPFSQVRVELNTMEAIEAIPLTREVLASVMKMLPHHARPSCGAERITHVQQ